jgi:hypothetical protein
MQLVRASSASTLIEQRRSRKVGRPSARVNSWPMLARRARTSEGAVSSSERAIDGAGLRRAVEQDALELGQPDRLGDHLVDAQRDRLTPDLRRTVRGQQDDPPHAGVSREPSDLEPVRGAGRGQMEIGDDEAERLRRKELGGPLDVGRAVHLVPLQRQVFGDGEQDGLLVIDQENPPDVRCCHRSLPVGHAPVSSSFHATSSREIAPAGVDFLRSRSAATRFRHLDSRRRTRPSRASPFRNVQPELGDLLIERAARDPEADCGARDVSALVAQHGLDVPTLELLEG